MSQQYTLQEFGRRVKVKYPEYANLSDEDLAKRVIAKYPQYRVAIKNLSEDASPSQTVQGPDGKLYLFPDGTTREQAIAYFRSKGIGASPDARSAPEVMPNDPIDEFIALPRDQQLSTLQSLSPEKQDKLLTEVKRRRSARSQPDQPSAASRFFHAAAAPIVGAVQAFNGNPTEAEKQQGLTSLYDTALRPFERVVEAQTGQVDEARDLANQGRYSEAAGHAIASAVPLLGPFVADATQEYYDQLGKGDTAGALGTAVGNMALTLAPEVAGKGFKALRSTAESARSAARTAAGAGKAPVEALVKETAEANKAGQGKADAAQAVETQRTDLTKKVHDTSEELRARIETARENAKTIGNEKYNTVNEKLNAVPANKGALIDGLVDAGEKIKGSQVKGAEANPRILQDIETRIQNGDEFTYEDLQGYYSELNNELTKGTLPGDVYAAYDTLHDAIGNEMQKIADEKGFGQQLTDARNYWRRMKQTFGKPSVARDTASKTLSSLSPEFVKEEQLKNRVRLLGHYDPEIERLAGEVTQAREKLKGMPKPKPTEFTPKTIGTEDIRNAKQKGVEQRAEQVRKGGRRIVNYGVGLHALWDAFSGPMEGLPRDIGLGVAGYTTAEALARALERPQVKSMLANVTAEDVARIPPEMRGDLSGVLEQAQKRGIKVSPALRAAVGSAGTVMGPRTQSLMAQRNRFVRDRRESGAFTDRADAR